MTNCWIFTEFLHRSSFFRRAVALESAHYLDALGSRVIIIQRSPQLLRGTDDDVAKVVENVSASEEWRFSREPVLRIERDGETRESSSSTKDPK